MLKAAVTMLRAASNGVREVSDYAGRLGSLLRDQVYEFLEEFIDEYADVWATLTILYWSYFLTVDSRYQTPASLDFIAGKASLLQTSK